MGYATFDEKTIGRASMIVTGFYSELCLITLKATKFCDFWYHPARSP